ncbi:MAG: class I SAM-dependent methyltransferase [Actinomycetota bacterium]|nr:class I SAM-dependent methyltransferase [Actinomycetota bacterium]
MSPEPVWPSVSTPPPISLPQPATDQLRIDAFERLLSLFPPGKVIDLGTGHGKLAIRAARMGWDVVGIDARTERFPDTTSVEFRHIDVREVSLEGFDLILCLGLFYHLTLDDQRALLARCAGTPMIIDTHLAVGESRMDDLLSEMVEVDGLQGRWFKEGTDTRSSWGNELAFWPTPESLGAMLRNVGYGVVLESTPWVMSNRRFFVALPPGYVSPTLGLRGQTKAFVRAVRYRASRRFKAARVAEV